MIKVVSPDSFNFDAPIAQLVDVHSRGVDKGWMTKRAAVLVDEIKNIKPEKGHSYIHLISLGAGEYVSTNRNGDWFNEKNGLFELPEPKAGEPKMLKLAGGLVEFHPTFMKGHVFKHHRNSSPDLAIGEIKAAAYNPEMHRGELLIKVAHGKEWDADLEKIASGQQVPFSMSLKEPYDHCSICGNRSPTRSYYCGHLKDNMTELTKEGHQVFAINDIYNFFDISKVFRPADRIAWSLAKVASAAVKGGAQLAEEYGLTEALVAAPFFSYHKNAAAKKAIAKKLAEIEKEVECKADGVKGLAGGCPIKALPQTAVSSLSHVPLGSALGALGTAKIACTVEDFLKLVMGTSFQDAAPCVASVKEATAGMFGRLLASGCLDELANDEIYDAEGATPTAELRKLAEELGTEHSMALEPVQRRMSLLAIRGETPPINLVKSGSAPDPRVEGLVKEYAKYLLSFVKTASSDGEENLVGRLTILRNYLKV